MKLRDTEEEVALIAESDIDIYAIKRLYRLIANKTEPSGDLIRLKCKCGHECNFPQDAADKFKISRLACGKCGEEAMNQISMPINANLEPDKTARDNDGLMEEVG